MCGIFCSINDNSVDLKKINNLQKHRGPDYHGVYKDDFISLAHQRLSIIDTNQRSNQPLIKKNLIIVFNGEIYNFLELKNKLIKNNKSIKFITNSDTEVILEYFRLYQEKCLDYFQGMFSFIIYDIKSKQTFVARDHFGIKPLYYTKINNSLYFSSELKVLVSLKGFDKKINKKTLISSVNYLWPSSDDSIFENTHKVPPSMYFKIDSNLKILKKKYWSIPKKEIKDSKKNIEIKLNSLIKKTIDKHLISDVKVSSFLSGGLDSSLISVISRKELKSLSTFTIATNNKDSEVEKMPQDQKYARKVADLYDLNHKEVNADEKLLNHLEFIVESLDEPIGDPAAINTYLICKYARENGSKVLLSGMGADEIFFGYRRHKAFIYSEYYKLIPKILRNFIESFVDKIPLKPFNLNFRFTRWLKRFISFASLNSSESYMRSYSYYSKDELYKIFKNSHHNFIDKIYQEHNQIFNNKFKGDIINQICYTDIMMFMKGLNLSYTDKSSMAASVEVRVPFIDKELISFVMNIPGKYKFNFKTQKKILKKISENHLPNEIIYRPKASFSLPIRSWMKSYMKPLINKYLNENNINKRGIFNYSFIKKLIDDELKGKSDNSYKLYFLISLEIWFQKFVD